MSEEKNQSTFFADLREIRQQKGISLESIADSYRIQLKYLKSMEDGDLLAIPEVYDKLFFRSYLKALGLDEDDYYDDFVDIRREIRIDRTTTIFDFSPKSTEGSKLINFRNIFVILPVIAIVAIIWLLVNNTEMIKSSSEPVQELDIKDYIRQIKDKQDSIRIESEKIDSLNLGVRALKKTWFRIIVDKADTAEYLLNRGQSMDLTAINSFEFLIGRADGLSLTLNGSKLPEIGTDTSVVRYLLVDSTGIAQKQIKTATF